MLGGAKRRVPSGRFYGEEKNMGACRFIKFDITGTKKLFNWHPSAGAGSWFFVDEIVVR